MYFDRFDICEAWYLLAHDWGLYAVITRLEHDLHFRPSPILSYDNISENAKEIYDWNDAIFIADHRLAENYTYNGRGKQSLEDIIRRQQDRSYGG